MIAPGKYRAKVLDWDFGRSGKGTPYIAVRFEIPSGDTITWFGYFTRAALERTVESLRYCGWIGHDINRMREDGMGSKEPEIVVEHEEYEGKVRARVQWVNSGVGPAGTGSMGEDELRAFAAEMRDSIRAIQLDKQQSSIGRDEQRYDDDIPF